MRSITFGLHSRRYGHNFERDVEALHYFLRCCSLPLSSIGIYDKLPDSAAVEALCEHLAQRPQLAALVLYGLNSGAGLQAAVDIQKQTDATFGDLRWLRIRIASRHANMIARAAPALTYLYLTLVDNDCGALTALAPLTQLDELIVHYGNGATLPSDGEMAALRHLRSLRALAGSSALRPILVTDGCFASIIETLPHLKRLRLAIHGVIRNLSGATLSSVGEQCQELERLEMLGVWDLSSWGNS